MKTSFLVSVFSFFSLLLISSEAFCQYVPGTFNTPKIDGSIVTGEYGNHIEGQNQITNGNITTYLTWDANNLYIAIAGRSVVETTILYLDKDNKHPALNNGGVGGSVGNVINGVQVNLPFDADIVIKAESNAVSYSTNNAGSWSAYSSTNTQYADNGSLTSSGVKEFSISWSVLGGKPAAFNFVSYNISSFGVIYNQSPIENPNGNGSPENFQYYYTVDSTGSGKCSYPFWPTKKSFSLLQAVSNAAAFDYFDFNANASSFFSITRNITVGGDWNIRNILSIGNGRIDFGNSGGTYGNTTIDSLIINGGTFTTNGSTKDLNISGGIIMTGGTLTINSSTPNFNIGTNFTKTGSGAILQTNNTSVNFNGTVQQVFNSSKSETIKFLKVSNTHPLGLTITNSPLNIGTSAKSSFNVTAGSLLKNDVIITIANSALGNIDGTIMNTSNGFISIPNTSPNTATVTISASGVYNHNRDGGAIPYFTWATGSLCTVTGWSNGTAGATLLQLDQTFSNFSWNSPGQTGNGGLNNNLNVNDFIITSTGSGQLYLSTGNPVTLNTSGKFQIDAGKFNLSNSIVATNININSNFIQNGGTIDFNPISTFTGAITLKKDFMRTGGILKCTGGIGVINIGDGTSRLQNINIANATSPSSSINFVIANSSTTTLQNDFVCNSANVRVNGSLYCGTYKVSGTSSFTMAPMSTLASASVDPGGTFMYTANIGSIQTSGVRAYSSSGSYEFDGASTQYTGDFTSHISPANQVNGLTINNSSPLNSTSGVYLTSPIKVMLSLVMTKGKLYSSSSNLLTLNNVSPQSNNTSFVEGPIQVIYPANQSAFPQNNIYPLGAGTVYLPLSLSNIATGAIGPSVTYQAFNSSSNGTPDLTINSLSNSEYWSAILNSGNFTSATLQLQRASDLGVYNLVGNSQTSNGTYSSLGSCTITNPKIQPNADITSLGYFTLGVSAGTPIINSIVPVAITGITTPNNSGYQGQTLTINGSNFLNSGMTITISGISVAYNFISGSQINIVVPSGIGTLSDFIIITNNSNGLFAKAVFNYNGYISVNNGDWNSGTTWLGNLLPPDNESVTILSNVSMKAVINPKSLIISSATSFTVDPLSNPSATLNIQSNLNNNGSLILNNNGFINFRNGGNFNNNTATFTQSGNSNINFQGNGTLLGTANFSSLTINGTVSFSPNITISAQGNLSLNSGALITSNAPLYSANSNLIYNTGSSLFTPGLEWSSSNQNTPGCPYNISIAQNATALINMNAGSKPSICYGNLSINSQGTVQFGNSSQTFTIVGDLTMDNNTSLILSSTLGGDLILKSNWINKGVITSNNGAVIFNDKTKDQIIYCQNMTNLNSLTIDKGAYKFISGNATPVYNLTISKTLTVSSGTFDMNNEPVVLLSTANNTANVSPIDITKASVINSSGLEVQRYIPQKRAWVMLSVPVNGSQTIHDSWQESQTNTTQTAYNNNPGYGVQITGPQTGVGFDISQQNNTSMLYYNSAVNKWTPIAGTTNTQLNAHDAYMLFVRGSRSVNIADGINAVGSPTTLRSTGNLIYGQQVFNVNASDNFTLIRNPYPSTIDFHQISKTSGLGDKFIVWDPYLTGAFGVGAFVTFTWNGSSYSSVPSPNSPLDQYIQSGQAFIVQGSGSSETITIDESNKLQANKALVFRPMDGNKHEARINLFSKNADNLYSLSDGTLAIYADEFSNKIDKVDAKKISNFSDNIGLQRDEYLLAIEARNTIMDSDSLNINLKASVNQYKMQVICNGLDREGLNGYLIDNYLKVETPLKLNDTITYSFEISSNKLSSDSLRFKILFRQNSYNTSRILSGEKVVNDVVLNWTIPSEIGVKNYQILRSENGADFTALALVASKSNDGKDVTYTFVDKDPGSQVNYYRIKINLQNGGVVFSNIINLSDNLNDLIKIYPNPIQDGNVNIHFKSFQKGAYKISIYNLLGQLFYSSIYNKDPSSNDVINIKAQLPHGKYLVTILMPNGSTISKSIYY